MTEQSPRKISRRDALKILAAATGAAALANIPGKWSKPGLEVGVLPAHAATSGPLGPVCGANTNIAPASAIDTVTSSVTISPVKAGVQMHFNAVCSNGTNGYFPQTGNATTDASGTASVALQVGCIFAGDTIQVTWTFVNPADGTGTCQQVFTSTTTTPC